MFLTPIDHRNRQTDRPPTVIPSEVEGPCVIRHARKSGSRSNRKNSWSQRRMPPTCWRNNEPPINGSALPFDQPNLLPPLSSRAKSRDLALSVMPENLEAQAMAKLLVAAKNDICACCRNNEPPISASALPFDQPNLLPPLSSRAKSRTLRFQANRPAQSTDRPPPAVIPSEVEGPCVIRHARQSCSRGNRQNYGPGRTIEMRARSRDDETAAAIVMRVSRQPPLRSASRAVR